MATGVTRYGLEMLSVPALRISVGFTIILLLGAAGNMLGPAAIIRDVTRGANARRP